MRWGVLVPATNTVAEVDFQRHAPEGVTVHTSRMYLEQTTADSERRMLEDELPRAARDLGTARPDIVIFSCTSAGAVAGPDGEPRMIDEIGSATSAEVVSTNAAVHEAIHASGAQRVAVVTAYVDELTQKIREGIERSGVDVSLAAGLGIVDPFAICEVTPEQIVAFAQEHVRPRDADLLFVSCTNLRAMDARAELEAALGIPVMTSNLAALNKAVAISQSQEVAL